jgi:hypothetical protein
MALRELGQMQLKFQGKAKEPPEGKLGTYLGGGDGTVQGPRLAGTVVWHLHENQGRSTCDAHFAGRIRTGDGANIDFEALGFFRREDDPVFWTLSSAIRFTTENPRYAWLDGTLGFTCGRFDMTTCTHELAVYTLDGMRGQRAVA